MGTHTVVTKIAEDVGRVRGTLGRAFVALDRSLASEALYVELPAVGEWVDRGALLCRVLTRDGRVIEVASPISGRVVETNTQDLRCEAWVATIEANPESWGSRLWRLLEIPTFGGTAMLRKTDLLFAGEEVETKGLATESGGGTPRKATPPSPLKALGLLIGGPLLGLAYVIFLPVLGLGMLGWVIGKAIWGGIRR